MIVVDASVLAVALGDDGTDGRRARTRLIGETLVAPEVVDLEVVSVWRRQVAAKRMTAQRAGTALSDPAIQDLERQILRARALLAERGEILEDVRPPLQSGGSAPAPTTQPAG